VIKCVCFDDNCARQLHADDDAVEKDESANAREVSVLPKEVVGVYQTSVEAISPRQRRNGDDEDVTRFEKC
jgi:hypothetical protein